MSAKKPNISQIDQYLQGKLDARAMHQLERQAQDDPFLMDALEGYEKSGKDHQENLTDLKERLAKRTASAKQRSLILWRVIPIAATVLLMLGAGYWFFKPETEKKQYVVKVTDDNLLTPPPPTVEKRIIVDPKNSKLAEKKIYKTDPTEYIADNNNISSNTTVDELLKKTDGMEVNPDGSITVQGETVTKVRVNGKDFASGNLSSAVQNLPADIVDKIQIVDDYGDQAARTGIRSGNPTKVLDITLDSVNKTGLIAVNKAAPQLKEISIFNSDKTIVETKVQAPQSEIVGHLLGLRTNNNSANTTGTRNVSGKVLDKQGAPLIGATVVVEGTGNAVATDVNGDFKIALPANKDLLAVNYVGFNPQQVKVGNQSDLKIALDANEGNLNEVVVVAYGAQKKTRANSSACKENPRFKRQFFEHIATVEKYTDEQLTAAKQTIKPAAFKKALAFLTKYTKVPAVVLNDVGYKNQQTLKADKDQWVKWYEANKCNNLK